MVDRYRFSTEAEEYVLATDYDALYEKYRDKTKEAQRRNSAHADMARRNRLFIERLDMPVERIKAHGELVKLQQDYAALQSSRQELLAAFKSYMYHSQLLYPRMKKEFQEAIARAEALGV